MRTTRSRSVRAAPPGARYADCRDRGADDHSDLKAASRQVQRVERAATGFSTGVKVARWAGHIVSVDGRPAVIAGMTIVPNIDMGLLKSTPNLLISITYIDEAFIAEIGRSLLLNDLALAPHRKTATASYPRPLSAMMASRRISELDDPAGPGQVLLTIILPLVALGVFAHRHPVHDDAAAASGAPRESSRGGKRRRGTKPSTMRLSGLAEPRAHGREDRGVSAKPRGERHRPARCRRLSRYRSLQGHQRHAWPPGRRPTDQRRSRSAWSDGLRPKDFLSRFGGDEFVILCAPAGLEASSPAGGAHRQGLRIALRRQRPEHPRDRFGRHRHRAR